LPGLNPVSAGQILKLRTFMHELGIAKDLFDIVLAEAKKNSLGRVSKIVIRLGKASGIEKEFLLHSLAEHVIPGTIAEGAEIEILPEDVRLKCRKCGKEIADKSGLSCGSCGNTDVEIVSGKDTYVESIESQ
jgi:hydrogenase nickel incorporation protein HypA/HybF